MTVWEIVQRAAFDRATLPGVRLFLWEAGGGGLLDGAETLQRVALVEAACVVLSGRRSSGLCCRERVLEVPGF